jgi:Na+-driven multidrug efflux pump
LATLIAGLVSVAVLIQRIYAKDLAIRLRGVELTWLKPSAAYIASIAKMGLPMGLSMIIMSGSALAMIGLINREGVDTAAAFGVMNQLWSYVQMPAVAVGSAVSAMAAQNIGAGRWDRVGKIAWAGVGINVAMTVVILAAITLFDRALLGLFLPAGSKAIPIAIHINHVIGWSYILMGISMVVTFIVRANGAVMGPLVILIISGVLVRFAIGFGLHDRYGSDAIWWAFIATGITSLILSVAYYYHGGWKKLSLLGHPAASV